MGRLIIDGLMAASTLESGMGASLMGAASLFIPQVGINIPSHSLVASHLAEMNDVRFFEHLFACVTGMSLCFYGHVGTKP